MTKFYADKDLPINQEDKFDPSEAQAVFDLEGKLTRTIKPGEYVVMQESIAIITSCINGVRGDVIATMEDETIVRPVKGLFTLKTEL